MSELAAVDPHALRGLVLAGGRSSRFGRDKGAEEFHGSSLLDRAVDLTRRHVAEVFVAVRPDQFDDPVRRRHSLIADEYPAKGPAAGIISAHRRFRDCAWLVVACDMPLLTDQTLLHLIRHRNANLAATAYRSPADGLPEPLCAIYEPATLARFCRDVDSGGNPSPRDLLAECLAARTLEFLVPVRGDELANVNTLDDLHWLGIDDGGDVPLR